MRKSRTMDKWIGLAVFVLMPLLGCAQGGKGGAVSLSIAANRDTELMVGDALTFSVRAVKSDGSSEEVTSSANCMLTGDATGTLDGSLFMATVAGESVIACGYEQASGTLVLTVRGPVLGDSSIEAVQTGKVTEGASLKLIGVVVTALAPATSSGAVDIFVQPEKGRADTGLFVVDLRASADPALVVGDVIDVTGTYVEKAGRSTIEADVIEKTGRAAPRVTELALKDLDLADYESALVRVTDVAVRDIAYTSYTWLLSDAENASLEVELDTYFFEPTTAQGSVLDALTGIVFCTTDGCAVAPRDDSDLALCEACENVAPAPPAGPPATPMMTRIEDIQTGVVAEGAAVILDELVVTALWPDGDSLDFWAQAAGGGRSSGLFFRDARPTPAPLALSVGSVVHVEGITALRAGYPLVSYASVEERASNSKVTVDQVSLAELVDATAGRRYWGALVEITDLSVTEVDVGGYGFTVKHGSNATLGFIGNALYPELTLATSDVLARVTGIVYLGASGLEIWPRDAQDVAR